MVAEVCVKRKPCVSGKNQACVCAKYSEGESGVFGALHISEGVPGCNQLGRDPLRITMYGTR